MMWQLLIQHLSMEDMVSLRTSLDFVRSTDEFSDLLCNLQDSIDQHLHDSFKYFNDCDNQSRIGSHFLKAIDCFSESDMFIFLQWVRPFDNIFRDYNFPVIACKKGYLKLLDHLLSLKYKCCDDSLVHTACQFGHIHILQYLKDKGMLNIYSHMALDVASEFGHVDVLNFWWLKTDGLPMKYSNLAVELASNNGHINVLEWWMQFTSEGKSTTCPLRCDFVAVFENASKNNQIEVLKWWALKGCAMDLQKQTSQSIPVISRLEHAPNKANDTENSDKDNYISKLDWNSTSVLDSTNGKFLFTFNEDAIDQASIHGHVEVLKWWKHQKDKFDWPFLFSSQAFATDSIEVLNWWMHTSGIDYESLIIDGVIDIATAFTNRWDTFGPKDKEEDEIQIIQWFKSNLMGVFVTDANNRLEDDFNSVLKSECNIEALKPYVDFETREEISLNVSPLARKNYHKAIRIIHSDFSEGVNRLNQSIMRFRVFSPLQATVGASLVDEASISGSNSVLDYLFYLDGDQSEDYRMTWSHAALDGASAMGHIHTLNWFVNKAWDILSIRPFSKEGQWKDFVLHGDWQFTKHSVDWASANGHADVLDWWVAMAGAAGGAGVSSDIASILQLARDDPLLYLQDLKWSHDALTDACANGHLSVVIWWLLRQQVMTVKLNTDAIVRASKEGKVEILDWLWRFSKGDFDACVEVRWWIPGNDHDSAQRFEEDLETRHRVVENVFKMSYNNALQAAVTSGRVNIMKWWFDNYFPEEGPIIKPEINVEDISTRISFASNSGPFDKQAHIQNSYFERSGSVDVKVLEWLLQKKEMIKLHAGHLLDMASAVGRVDLLQFAVDHSNDFEAAENNTCELCGKRSHLMWSSGAMDGAAAEGHVSVLSWWYEQATSKRAHALFGCVGSSNRRVLEFTHHALDLASLHGRDDVMEWFWDHSKLKDEMSSKKSNLSVLLPLRFSNFGFRGAFKYSRVNIINWWLRLSNLQDLYVKRCKGRDGCLSGVVETNEMQEWGGGVQMMRVRDLSLVRLGKKNAKSVFDVAAENWEAEHAKWNKESL